MILSQNEEPSHNYYMIYEYDLSDNLLKYLVWTNRHLGYEGGPVFAWGIIQDRQAAALLPRSKCLFRCNLPSAGY